MADRVTEPGTSDTEVSDELVAEPPTEESQQAALPNSPPTIIWTPRFFVLFALTLVVGLSAESVLTQGWANHYYPAPTILLAHLALIFGCWIAVIAYARSAWVRVGGIFGCVWAIFAGASYVANFFILDPASPIPAHLNVAINSALFGAYICLSVERTALLRWDAWFFRLALFVGICSVPLTYFARPIAARSLTVVESGVAATLLVLCVLVWWMRPACWRTQPGPTLLFGLAPTLLLLLSIPNLTNAETNLFLLQVMMLCFLLGAMRILKCEIGN